MEQEQPAETQAPKSKNRSVKTHLKKIAKKPSKKTAVSSLLVLLILFCAGLALYYYKQYSDVKSNPKAIVEEHNKVETQAVIRDLKAVLVIEETDQPTVARVDDPEKLKKNNKEFYKNVQKGDYLILYPKRAIIFRQSTRQIVNTAPIIDTSSLNKTDSTQQTTTTEGSN